VGHAACARVLAGSKAASAANVASRRPIMRPSRIFLAARILPACRYCEAAFFDGTIGANWLLRPGIKE
jgi:hypothetical protein